MSRPDDRTDAELLAATAREPEAFALFYRRHLNAVVQYFMARTRDAELTADLTAETFAAALAASSKYRPNRGPVGAWLYAIARNNFADSLRRGRVEQSARQKLGLAPAELTDSDIERVEEIWAATEHRPLELLADLPTDIRSALGARVIDERAYHDIARELRCSEAVIRKRVSRGLSELRTRMRTTG